MDIPNDWIKVEIADKFRFWLPPFIKEVHTQGIDSFTRKWKSDDFIVYFDYGRFSDPLTLYSRKKSYIIRTDQINIHTVTIVSFKRDNDWNFTGVHFPDLGKDDFGQTMKLTVIVEAAPAANKENPLKIIRSIDFYDRHKLV